jgi:hypothetical protein
MGLHDSFGHLEHRLWPQKRSGVNHGKSGINSIPLCSNGVRHAVGKLSMKATTSIETSSRLKVCTRSYSPTKLWDSQPWRFRDSHLGVSGQKAIRMPFPQGGAEYTIWGKVVASPESGPWWVLWVQSHPCLVLTPSVLRICITHFVLVLCKSM